MINQYPVDYTFRNSLIEDSSKQTNVGKSFKVARYMRVVGIVAYLPLSIALGRFR